MGIILLTVENGGDTSSGMFCISFGVVPNTISSAIMVCLHNGEYGYRLHVAI